MNTSMAQQDRPNSMRIRFEDNWHRLDAIEEAAELYDRNRTDAVTLACDDMARLAGVLEDFLDRDDLTKRQQRERAEDLDRALSLDVEITREVEIK